MAKALITESYLEDIGDAIRAKLESEDTYKPSEMADAIMQISGGATLIAKNITENGTYYALDDEADGYSSVVVDVAGGGGDEPSLPSEYQEVEYIETDGNQWLSVNVETQANDAIRCWTALSSLAGTNEAGFVGTGTNGWELYYQNNKIYSYNVKTDVIGSERSIERDTKTESYIVLDRSKSSFLWGRYRTDNYPFNGRLYKFYLFRNIINVNDNPTTKIMCLLIPCYRKSDDVIGMYDVINDVFYTNAGTGSFSKGPNV